MAFQLNEGQGSLFINAYKDANDPNDRKPHLKGHCLINGQEKDIAAWWAQKQDGTQYLQLKISDPRPRQQAPQGGYAPQPQPHPQYQPQPQYQPRGQQAQGYPQGAPQTPPQQPQNNLEPQPNDLPF